MSALEVLLVGAVLFGMSVQSAIGFGFAFFVAPAAFAAFAPEQAVTLVLGLAIAINCLVLFGERRTPLVARREVAIMIAAAIPGILLGAWALTRVEPALLQFAVGVVVLAGAAVQWQGASSTRVSREPAAAPVAELGGGFAAGALTTSVSINGPASPSPERRRRCPPDGCWRRACRPCWSAIAPGPQSFAASMTARTTAWPWRPPRWRGC